MTTPDAETMMGKCARAAFGVLYPHVQGHDYDSDLSNLRGHYLDHPTPSRVDRSKDVVRAVLEALKSDPTASRDFVRHISSILDGTEGEG